MRSSPSIAPAPPDDIDVYLVLDDFGERLGRAWRETGEERTDRQTVLNDLIERQYSNPVRIAAFNSAEGRSRDVSEDLADEIAHGCAMDGFDAPPPYVETFIKQHGSEQPHTVGAAATQRRVT